MGLVVKAVMTSRLTNYMDCTIRLGTTKGEDSE